MPRAARFPFRTLPKALTAAERAAVTTEVRGLLDWQARLAHWPRIRAAPDATPFSTLYAHGRLCGCFGSHEGSPGERLARAFVLALGDGRHAGITPAERPNLAAEISYLRRPTRTSVKEAAARVEVGTHGLAFVSARGRATLLLPSVARDHRADSVGMLALLARKAGTDVGRLNDGTLFLFETEEIVVRPRTATAFAGSPIERAVRWLASLVEEDGAIAFGLDARTGARARIGEMTHARRAVALAALARAGSRRIVARGRSRLAADLRAALGRRSVEGWPDDPARAAGTLALAAIAGVVERDALFRASRRSEVREDPWHAAQVAAALGAEAPSDLWAACVAHLEARPWAPWTAIAARSRGDARTLNRSARALVDSIRESGPHRGGVSVTEVPEVALTAIAIEALFGLPGARERAASKRAKTFIARWQIDPAHAPASIDPAIAGGAFVASPVIDYLRCDVTGHAVLALSGESVSG